MENQIRGLGATRREFLWSSSILAGALALPAGLLNVASAIAAGEIKDVPRNRTLVTVRGGREGKHTEHELWSPYVIGSNPQLGGNIIYEPLAFYSAFADKETLWLAESYSYSADYKELTVKTRSGINWSDGKPFSAEDVAYSLNTLNELGEKVKWGKDVQEVMESATVVDPNTTLIKFKVPAPRFFFHMLSYKYDIGLHIVPKHIFEGQDWTTFAAFDLSKEWPVTTGPWKVVNVSPTQKVLDRRDSWWGVGRGGRETAGCRADRAPARHRRAATRPGPHLQRRRLLDRLAGRNIPDRVRGKSQHRHPHRHASFPTATSTGGRRRST